MTTNKTEKAGNGREPARPPVVQTARSEPEEQGLERKGDVQVAWPSDLLHPFGLMRRMFRELDRMIGGAPTRFETRYFPQFDVVRRGDNIVVRADLPGISASDIEVTLDDGALVVSGERHDDRELHEGDVWRTERTYGRFERVIALPDGVDAGSVDARFDNGVLVIELRAPEQPVTGKKIEVKTGEHGGPATTH